MRHSIVTLLAVSAALQLPAQRLQPRRVAQLDCSGCALPAGVHLSPAGDRVTYLDGQSPHVRVFVNGALVREFGRAGSGPGEFRGPYFVAVNRSGTIAVVDVLTRQLSWLQPTGELLQRVMLPAFPSNVSQVADGESLLFVWNDFRGAHTAQLWPFGAATGGSSVKLPSTTDLATPYPLTQRADGSWAMIPDYSTYRITRRSADGKELPALTRDIERVRRTPEEEAELRNRLARGPQKSREERRQSKSAASVLPPNVELSLKPHFRGAAVQYDDASRLWVMTARGDHTKTVFDLFDRNDKFLGSVELPVIVQAFSVRGNKVAVAGTDVDGLPVLEIWEIT